MPNRITVVFDEDKNLSTDGINTKTFKKKTPHTAENSVQQRLFEHLLEKGEAKIASPEPTKDKSKPSETKKKKSKSKSKNKKSS